MFIGFKVRKKALAVLAILVYVGCVSVASAQFQFYGGASAGYGLMKTKTRSRITFTEAGGGVDPADTSFRKEPKGEKLATDLMLGVRYFINSFFIGTELSFVFDKQSVAHRFTFAPDPAIPDFTRVLKTTLRRNVALIPAITVGKSFGESWLVFAKLGVAISRFELELQVRNPIPATFHSGKKTVYGIAPSLGFEYSFHKNMALTGVFTYEQYGVRKKDFASVITNPGDDFASIGDTVAKPRVYSFKVGFIIKTS